jgi:hypothetical protein
MTLTFSISDPFLHGAFLAPVVGLGGLGGLSRARLEVSVVLLELGDVAVGDDAAGRPPARNACDCRRQSNACRQENVEPGQGDHGFGVSTVLRRT